jgi:hypothetical protein
VARTFYLRLLGAAVCVRCATPDTSPPDSSIRDVISDFRILADKIDLMDIDADTTVTGNQAFRWVGAAALTGAGHRTSQ